jgi:hypothetical protein
MSFVKLSIFGTSFEVSALVTLEILLPVLNWHYFCQVTTRYVDLQPVGMGMFLVGGLPISLIAMLPRCFRSRLVSIRRSVLIQQALISCNLKLGQGSAHRVIRGHQEDNETIQHSRAEQAHLSRAQAPEAHSARERKSCIGGSGANFSHIPRLHRSSVSAMCLSHH